MLKLVGAVMVVIASGLTGLAVANSYSRRPRELRSLRSALQILETEIAYGATYLPEALELVAARCGQFVQPLFERAARELKNMSGNTATEAWEKSLEAFYPTTALRPQDLMVLKSLGSSLGISDREDQIKHLHLAVEHLTAETRASEEEAARNVKLWSYLGFLGGLTIVLVLF